MLLGTAETAADAHNKQPAISPRGANGEQWLLHYCGSGSEERLAGPHVPKHLCESVVVYSDLTN